MLSGRIRAAAVVAVLSLAVILPPATLGGPPPGHSHATAASPGGLDRRGGHHCWTRCARYGMYRGQYGEKARKRRDDTRDELTPHEKQIARLAREGLSNPEIGARLFLSPRTVEWHLHHVFTELGIQSRRELESALSASESEVVPA